jgi:hypothetical protein
MAGPFTIDTFNAMTDKFYIRQCIDNFFLSSPTLAKLRANEKEIDGGADIRQPISYTSSPNAGRWGGGMEVLPTSYVENATQAVFTDVHYMGTVTLPKTLINKNKGRAQIIDLVRSQVELMEVSLRDSMGLDVFLDGTAIAGHRGLDGLSAIITSGADPGPGAYGTITRVGASGSKRAPVGNGFWNGNVLPAGTGVVTVWKGDVDTGATTILSLNLMQQAFGASSQNNEFPDLIVTSQILYSKYWSLLTSIQRQASSELTGMAGFKFLLFNDTPVTVDDNIDLDTKMYFLNTGHIVLRPYTQGNFEATPFAMPVNQLAMIKVTNWQGQVVSDRPNLQTVLTLVTAS